MLIVIGEVISLVEHWICVVSETQGGEGFWFSLSALFPVTGSEPPELDQSCLVRV